MKTFRLAFLLGILSTTLVGCGNGGGPKPVHTITFDDSKGCTMVNSKGESVTSVSVIDGASVSYTIKVNDPTTYNTPSEITITCDGADYSEYSYTNGSLSIPSVTANLAIIAVAESKTGHTILYRPTSHDASHVTWTVNPSHINPNTDLEVKFKADYNYEVTKDNVSIKLDGTSITNFDFLAPVMPSESYAVTVSKTELVKDGLIVIDCRATHVPEKVYNVTINLGEHIASDFPATVVAHSELGSYIQADEGYRLPDSVTIRAQYEFVEGTDYIYEPNAGEYEGRPYGYIYIYASSVIMGRSGIQDDVIITGEAIEQVQVTFRVGATDTEGHWTDGESDHKHDPRIGTIDKGKTLGDAATAAGADVTPVKEDEDPAYQFNGWFDENGSEIGSGVEVNDNLVVHAQYAIKSCAVINEISKEITVSPELPKSVNYNASLTEVTFTAKTGYRLPEKEKVSVTMRHIDEQGDHWEPIGFNNFNYEREDGNTTATFSIGENIITGDIKIAVTPILYYSITFDPDGGTWPTGGTAAKTTTVPADYTYAKAFDTLKTRGNPTKNGQKLSVWKWGTTEIDMKEKIKADGMTLKAEYSEIVTFQNDSWANVIKHAEAGDLKETYLDTIFLGAERTLTYVEPMTSEEKNYQVRVIDSGYDRYYTEDGEMVKSALTFEFVDLVGEGEYGKIPGTVPGTYVGKNSWGDSTYRSFLGKFYEIICKRNEGFKAKPAIKYTLHGYVTPEEKDIIDPRERFETTEYFFPLSGAEMGIADSNGATYGTKYPEQQRENEAVVEGITVWPYEYYRGDTHSRVKKMFGADEGKAYWLRSPKIYSETDPEAVITANNYIINESGGTSTDYGGRSILSDYDYYGYMAAFCI